MIENYTDNANVFKALSDENRLKILELLRQGEKCGSELLEKLSISQSTLSHHLKLMCVSGIIKSRKSGTATYYGINPDGAKNAVALLCEITGSEVPAAESKDHLHHLLWGQRPGPPMRHGTGHDLQRSGAP